MYLVLGICSACEGGLIFQYINTGNAKENSPCGCPSDPEGFSWRLVNLYPSSTEPNIPPHAGEALEKFYMQAANALARQDYDASGAMSRKVVDVSTKQLLGDDANKYRSIKDRIDALAKTGRITPDLKDWAHEIRLGGNDASHDEDPYTEPEAKELLDFAELYLTYVYTLPGRLEKRQLRAQEAKANQEAKE